jgi:dTDP-4-amino-4,6-dideoxygalactose transaminase
MNSERIQFVDLQAQYRVLEPELLEAMGRVLQRGDFILGEDLQRFEREFAAFCRVPHCVGVANGTDALHLALLAGGVGAGDEVITCTHTFIATVVAIHQVGARPVLVDCDPLTYTIDVAAVERAITPRTKALLPVHLYGQPADMDPILELAKKYNLLVLEDACQAHGAEYKGRRCGSIGDIAAFSFYPGKNLGAYGEGGAVTTNRDDLAKVVRALRDWGQEDKRGVHLIKGFNNRLEGIQGAVLGVKMKYIEAWTEGRRRAAAKYDEFLKDIHGVTTPARMSYGRHVNHVYAVLVKDRASVQKRLQESGVSTGVHYPCAIHQHKALADLGYRAGDFPAAERLASEELSLPMFPELTEEQINHVSSVLRKS